MPLYFFHLREDGDLLLDEEGREFSNDTTMHKAALAEARAIISDEAKDGMINLRPRIDVEDEQHTLVHSIGFDEAVRIVPAVQG